MVKDKKQLLICIGLLGANLLIVLGCYYSVVININNKEQDIVDNKQEIDGDVEDNLTSSLGTITLNDEEYLWKMKVINPDGAYVYDTYIDSCVTEAGKLVCNNENVVTKLEYGTIISVFGDIIDQYVLTKDGVDYDNFTLDQIKDYYSVMISYSVDGQKNEIGYIKYNDLILIEGNNYFSNEYDNIKKYYVSNEEMFLYDGPGLLFERKNNLLDIPKGELLEVKYYNNVFGRRWLYVAYGSYSFWVMQCHYSSVNEPYSIVVNNCVDEVSNQRGKVVINQDNVFLYKYAMDNESVAVIAKGTEITYDYEVIRGPGMRILHTNYNGIDGYIIGIEVNEKDCPLVNDGKLYIVSDKDGNIKTCY